MLRLQVFNTGWIHMLEKDLFVGGRNEVRTLPVLSFVIEHPRGLFVFDTGLNPSLVPHSRRFVGRPSERVIRFQSAAEMTLSVQMQERGLSPEDVTHVALSHLHCDHTGDLRAFPQAQVLLTRQEWQAAQSPLRRLRGNLDPRYSGLSPTLIDLPVDDSSTPGKIPKGSYSLDCMGDGSLVLVPTFGHTPGHQSLLLFLPHGVVLLAGDAVYVREGYTKPAAQPHARCPDIAWRSLIALRALAKADPSAIILPAHDSRMLRGLERPDMVIDHTGLSPPVATPSRRL